MSSPKWAEVLGPDAEPLMLAAVATVAERSFFAVVERCDGRRFARLKANVSRWLVATIHFSQAASAGEVSCTVSEELAVALFDAFTGREPLGPPRAEELLDLLGEFANMACGSWLTRLTPKAGFVLAAPTVKWTADGTRPAHTGPRLLLAINDLPLAVEVRAAPRAVASARV